MRLYELLGKQCLFVGFSKHKDLIEGKLNATFQSWGKVDLSKLSRFDIILLGAMRKSRDKGKKIVEYAKDHKIPVLMYGSLVEDSKVVQHKVFKDQSFNHPKSVSGTINELDRQDIEDLGFPLVAKPEEGEQGKGVEKIKDAKELSDFLTKHDGNFVFQEFLPNDGDYRLFYFNHKLLFTIKRSSKDAKEFRNNISLGGAQEFVQLPKEVTNFAAKIDKHFNYDFAGIDLINHKGEWKVLEVNTSPQFIDKESIVIPAIINYIKQL